jgi:hypothetical protein
MHSRHRFYVFCGSLAALAAPLVAVAADNSAPTPATNEKPAISYRAEEPAENFVSDLSKIAIENRADGTIIYHMNGQGMQSIKARIGADGKLSYECTDAADKAITGAQLLGNTHEQ